MEALLAELEPRWGEGEIFRPYRDVRFSRDKSPYKTHIGAMVGAATSNWTRTGWRPAAACGRWRRTNSSATARPSTTTGPATKLATLVAKARAAGLEVMSHDVLKTAPRGYPKDHPRIELLRYKGIVTWRGWPAGAWLGTKRAKDRVSEFLERSQPLREWLDANVGPSTLTARR